MSAEDAPATLDAIPTDAGPTAEASPPITAPALAAVVCLGASAGGLEALSSFFSALPPCDAVAFVVVQHLSPDHKTMMHDLLGHQTSMPVAIAQHEQELVSGHVYVIPPGMTMTLIGERLQLVPKRSQGLSLPIDDFFQSLAEHFGPKAVGIILSGTGSDGSRGAQTLADAGGTVLVQTPMSARFDGMPRSAVATGVADLVGNPAELAAHVAAMVRAGGWPQPAGVPGIDAPTAPSIEPALGFVLQTLRALMRIDFSDYKPDMLIRRLQRRMLAVRAQSMDEYLARIEGEPEEVDALRRDLLIPVTRFLRDAPAWESLREKALRMLVDRQAAAGQPVRAWVAACSTGEEAYTVAILLAELCREQHTPPDFKVFATDVEQQYIDRAGAGRFAAAAMNELPASWRERWFDPAGEHHLQVKPELRQHIVFARHNLLADAPFTQMDLVTCRNMLIYLRPTAQERALRRLEYALKTHGVLFLGSSESPTGTANDLSVVDLKHKVFLLTRKAPPLPAEDLRSPMAGGSRRYLVQRQIAGDPRLRDHRAVDRAGEALIIRFAPPALLVNTQRELVHVFGAGRRFVSFRTGSASLDVLDLLPPPLPPVVATLMHSALRDRAEKVSREVQLHRDGDGTPERLTVSVRPLVEQGAVEHLLVCFEPAQVAPATGDRPAPVTDIDAESQRHVSDLEQELADTRDNLQTTIQELGLSNEELQATNEELMASNEELQSTNEELQSVNEELHTVNSEFQQKIDALNAANADLESLTLATHLPTLFVDSGLELTRFTPESKSLFRLRDADVGRSLEDIAHRLDYPELFADIRRAVAGGVVSRREVRSHDGAWYLTTVQPYHDNVQKTARAVLTFVDVSTLKDAQRLQAVLDSLPEHVALLDPRGAIVLVNRAWRAFAEHNGDIGARATGPGVNYLDVCSRAGDHDGFARRAAEGLNAVLSGRQPGFSLQYPCHSPNERRWFLMQAAPLLEPSGGCVVSHLNITAWVETGRQPPPSLAEPGTARAAPAA